MNLKEKRQILEREFYELDYTNNQKLTKEELVIFLDKKSKTQQFERNLFSQLYERVEKDFNKKVAVSDFINVFLEAEEILKSKVENSKQYLEDYHRQRREACQKLEECQGQEQLNQYGIMHSSKLSVDILQFTQNGQYLPEGSQVQVSLQCGQDQYDSNLSQNYNGQGGEFIFNEHYSFNIQTGMEDLSVMIQHLDKFQNQLLGQLTIPLNRFKDQHKHEEAFDLYGPDGHFTQSKIWLKLEWIYSRDKYLKELVKKWETQIQMTNDDLIDYEKDLANLYQPFPTLLRKYMNNILNASQNNNNIANNQLGASYLAANQFNTPQRISNKSNLNEYEKVEVKAVKMQGVLGSNSESLFMARMLFIGLIAVTSLIFLYKTQFYDLLICFAFITQYEQKQLNTKTASNYLKAMGIAILIDLLWIYNFHEDWWSKGMQESYMYRGDPVIDHGLRKFIIIFVWISLFLKAVIALTLYQLTNFFTTQDTRQEPFSSTNDLQNNNYDDEYNQYSNNNIQQQYEMPLETENNQLPNLNNNNNYNDENNNNINNLQYTPINVNNNNTNRDLSPQNMAINNNNYNQNQNNNNNLQQYQNGQVSAYYPVNNRVVVTQNTPTPIKNGQQLQSTPYQQQY